MAEMCKKLLCLWWLSFLCVFLFLFWGWNLPMNSRRALPQQQQLHGLHLFGDWQQRLQLELISEGLGPAGAVQQARLGEVHGCLPAARGRVGWEPLSCCVVEWLRGWQSMASVCQFVCHFWQILACQHAYVVHCFLYTVSIVLNEIVATFRLTSRHSWL